LKSDQRKETDLENTHSASSMDVEMNQSQLGDESQQSSTANDRGIKTTSLQSDTKNVKPLN